MDDMTMTYYTLRFEQTDQLHRKGETVVITSGELRIGQQDDCDVAFSNASDYEDELYAIIRPAVQEGEWLIVPASEHVRTFVNGQQVNLLRYLEDGDRISFDTEEQELLFRVRHDDRYAASKGVSLVAPAVSRKLIALLVAVPVVLFAILTAYIMREKSLDRDREMLLDSLRASVLQISVDSVLYYDGDSVLGRYSYLGDEGHVISGTAFVTDDGRLITARHCIEPWLNDMDAEEAASPADIKSVPSRWAMEAETYNQLNDTRPRRVVAVCNLYRGAQGTEKFGNPRLSSEFIVDQSRDFIVEKGDFNNVYFWRTIRETYSNKDMMLGDVAWVPTDSVGNIAIAPGGMLGGLLSPRRRLYFMGYPDHNTQRGFNMEEGRMQMDFEHGRMIAHGGNLIHGYSGAPVIVIDDVKAYAVGVVSRLDANGGARAYSVPVTELLNEE